MLKFLTIIICLFAFACGADDKKQGTAVYDEASLKAFVFATAGAGKEKSPGMLDSLLSAATKDSAVFTKTIAFLEMPFGNPNSPYRDEALYIELLQKKMRSGWTDSLTRAITRNELYLRMQNQVGTTANDFVYSSPSGIKRKLHDLEANYTLLYFNNPDCHACKEMKEAITASQPITQKLKSGELKILALYTDRDEKLWLDHLPHLPEAWIPGRDEEEYLYRNKIYDLRAIPTLYLLDNDKKVLLKDCVDVKEIEQRLKD